MTPAEVVRDSIIEPTYMGVLPGRFASRAATVLLLAIGLQESRLVFRQQIGGPARGLWQFERGGVAGVLAHAASDRFARAACLIRGVVPTAATIYDRLAHDDLLACAFARLLLYTDPRPLPAPGEVEASWSYYLRTWRPGKPHRATWDALYASAIAAIETEALL